MPFQNIGERDESITPNKAQTDTLFEAQTGRLLEAQTDTLVALPSRTKNGPKKNHRIIGTLRKSNPIMANYSNTNPRLHAPPLHHITKEESPRDYNHRSKHKKIHTQRAPCLRIFVLRLTRNLERTEPHDSLGVKGTSTRQRRKKRVDGHITHQTIKPSARGTWQPFRTNPRISINQSINNDMTWHDMTTWTPHRTTNPLQFFARLKIKFIFIFIPSPSHFSRFDDWLAGWLVHFEIGIGIGSIARRRSPPLFPKKKRKKERKENGSGRGFFHERSQVTDYSMNENQNR